MTLVANTEGQFTNKEGETLNFRIYSDGGSRVESLNSLEFFETIEQLEQYIKVNK